MSKKCVIILAPGRTLMTRLMSMAMLLTPTYSRSDVIHVFIINVHIDVACNKLLEICGQIYKVLFNQCTSIIIN